MGRFSIVSKVSQLEEYLNIAKEYEVCFEINDFFEPDILEDADKQSEMIELYLKKGLPKNSTMHGAFYDLTLFSRDSRIREVSYLRMVQSMEIARRLGVSGVVFHTNHNPNLSDDDYINGFIDTTSKYLKELLEAYPEINIYLENMFDITPHILLGVSKQLEKYENFGVCLDWSHAIIYGTSLEGWIKEIAGYVKHIHINDNDLVSDLHLPIGSGKVDWQYFMNCYHKYFPNCSILIETDEPNGQRKSLDYLKQLFLDGRF